MKIKRNITVNVKFSPEEKTELEKIAIDIGSDFAAWIRQAALEQRKIILGKRYRPIQHDVQQKAVAKSTSIDKFNMQSNQDAYQDAYQDAFIKSNEQSSTGSSTDITKPVKTISHIPKKMECKFCYDEFKQVSETQMFCSTNCEDQFNSATKRCSQCELQWLGASTICPECEYLNGLKNNRPK
jgi:predicted nucleic acid-binding Zn ribbon protein